jgi:hypothetical protein
MGTECMSGCAVGVMLNGRSPAPLPLASLPARVGPQVLRRFHALGRPVLLAGTTAQPPADTGPACAAWVAWEQEALRRPNGTRPMRLPYPHLGHLAGMGYAAMVEALTAQLLAAAARPPGGAQRGQQQPGQVLRGAEGAAWAALCHAVHSQGGHTAAVDVGANVFAFVDAPDPANASTGAGQQGLHAPAVSSPGGPMGEGDPVIQSSWLEWLPKSDDSIRGGVSPLQGGLEGASGRYRHRHTGSHPVVLLRVGNLTSWDNADKQWGQLIHPSMRAGYVNQGKYVSHRWETGLTGRTRHLAPAPPPTPMGRTTRPTGNQANRSHLHPS